MTPTERVLARCDLGDCWRWQGAHIPQGYGSINVDGKSRRVHRVVWEGLVGPIPEGLVLDHLCQVKDCVNPDHLRLVTQRENVLAGHSIMAKRAKQTHCIRGHPLSGDNLYVYSGGRQCRTCKRVRHRRWKETQ